MKIDIKPPAGIDWQALEAEVQQALADTVAGAVQLVRNDMVRSIGRGTKSGRVYARGRGGKRAIVHRASAPGEPPATDTGTLVRSIVADSDGLMGYVEARADYAVHLEFGTRRMAARPFMTPAVEGNRAKIGLLMHQALATGVAAFARKPRRIAHAAAAE